MNPGLQFIFCDNEDDDLDKFGIVSPDFNTLNCMKYLISIWLMTLLLSCNAEATIIVALGLKDGIVIAADSRATITDINSTTTYFSDTAEKLIPFHDCVVGLYGLASVGQEDMKRLIEQINIEDKRGGATNDNQRFGYVAWQVGSLLVRQYEKWFSSKLLNCSGGCMVFGYCKDLNMPTAMVIYSEDGHRTITQDIPEFHGLLYRGQTDIISRLLYGIDEYIAIVDDKLSLEREPSERNDYYTYRDRVGSMFNKYSYIIPYDKMTISDGIEFARFLVETTIQMQNFSKGTTYVPRQNPGVGGSVDILTITADGVKWVQNKREIAE